MLREERAKSWAVTLGRPEGRERSMHASFDFTILGLAYFFIIIKVLVVRVSRVTIMDRCKEKAPVTCPPY